MKNKILSKMMMVALIFCSMFLISACSWQKEVNITSIEVKEGTVPESIMVGQFDNAGIKLVITYDDDSTEEIPVTSEMIPEEYQSYLTTPGIYEIQILFKGNTTEITVKIVEEAVFTVNFYNGNGLLVSSQQVKQGESATEPTSQLLNIAGFELVAWDVDFTNIQKDTKVYAIYTGIENVITDEIVLENWHNVIDNYYTSNNVTLVDYTITYNSGRQFIHSTNINYHYDGETGLATSQKIYSDNNGRHEITECDSNGRAVYNYYDVELAQESTYNYYAYDSETTEEKNEQALVSGVGGISYNDEEVISVSYRLYNNKLIYIVNTFSEYYGSSDTIQSTTATQYLFTEDEIISMTNTISNEFNNSSAVAKFVVEYGLVDFQGNLIPDEVKNSNNE